MEGGAEFRFGDVVRIAADGAFGDVWRFMLVRRYARTSEPTWAATPLRYVRGYHNLVQLTEAGIVLVSPATTP